MNQDDPSWKNILSPIVIPVMIPNLLYIYIPGAPLNMMELPVSMNLILKNPTEQPIILVGHILAYTS